MASDKNYFSELPKWAQGVVAVSIIAGLGIIGWKTYQYFHKKSEDQTQKKVGDESGSVVAQLKKQGQNLAFPTPNYSATANTIQRLLDGCERVVSEIQVVEEIIKLVKKPIDWYYLISVFGNRDIADCGTFGVGSTNYDLVSLLKQQLDSQLIGDKINGKTYWNVKSITPLVEHLQKIGISL